MGALIADQKLVTRDIMVMPGGEAHHGRRPAIADRRPSVRQFSGSRRWGVSKATIRVWDTEECERVHQASLTVLAECGVEVLYGPALKRFAAAGARVEGTRVRLPKEMVAEALESAPRTWTVRSRGRDEVLYLRDGETYFGTGSDCLYISDPDSGLRRRAVLADIEELAALCEKLANVDFVMSMGFPENVPPEVEALSQQVAMLKGTRKPLLLVPRDGHMLEVMRDMAEACGGGGQSHRLRHALAPVDARRVRAQQDRGVRRAAHPARLRAGADRGHDGARFGHSRRRHRQRRSAQRAGAAPALQPRRSVCVRRRLRHARHADDDQPLRLSGVVDGYPGTASTLLVSTACRVSPTAPIRIPSCSTSSGRPRRR